MRATASWASVFPGFARLVASYADVSLANVTELLESPWHEERLFALFLLINKYERGGTEARARIARLYLGKRQFINNWDLVDSSAHLILGPHLQNGDRRTLDRFARSPNLWERRMAMLTTLCYIRQKDYADALRIATLLMDDKEDLIHKAVGWMLREVGNRDPVAARAFLDTHAAHMPRTMLRYAIEKFPADERHRYLKGASS